ncbi:MAG: aldolase/citrate lyase family protein [Pseudomonadota bacterium]
MVSPKEKLERVAGPLPAGCVWLGLGSATAAEVVARSGARLAVVDAEHGEATPARLPDILRALALGPCGAIVRVGEVSSAAVKRALDAGADGILFPQIETPAEARAAAASALFPPRGVRGSALGVVRAAGFGTDADYGRDWNDRAIIAVQIESVAGLSQVNAIAEVADVDMLFFGPFDYAAFAGLDPEADGDVLAAAFTEIVEAAHEHGKIAGVFPWPGVDTAALATAGSDMIAIASDIRAVADGVSGALAALAAVQPS